MGENSRLENAERWEELIGRNSRSGTWHRLRQVLWAGLVAFAFFALSFFEPIDQVSWSMQSRLSSSEPSGQFAYIGADRDLADPYSPARRTELAQVLNKLDQANVERVYLDFVFDDESTALDDAALKQAIAGLGGRVAFVPEVVDTLSGDGELAHTLPAIRGEAPEYVNPNASDILNVTWWMPRMQEFEGRSYQTLAYALIGGSGAPDKPIQVDYAIPLGDLIVVDFDELLSDDAGLDTLAMLEGKRVVLGENRSITDSLIGIPGSRNIPRGIIAIYAAESHVAGRTLHLDALQILLITVLALGVCATFTNKRFRRSAYALLSISIPGLFLFAIFAGARVEPAHSAFLLLVFMLIRLRFHWQRRASMRDEETGLGTLRALEEALTKAKGNGFVVVAKVHGYERVLKLLPTSLQPTYVRKIAERLKATEPELELFAGAHYFAWYTQENSADELEDHLDGTRALFSAPLDIAGTPVDVGMTFGVARISGVRERSLPAAMAAVEETSEAHEPIRFAVERSQDENLWDISLRSRIDAAMNNGEVYCLYQPKYALNSESVCGIEALVRWDDHERGPIPPMVFIQESEKAGRMDQLTRYVLQSACTAGRLLHSRGYKITVSVNVSAIMCSDSGIVDLVEEALKASGFPASHLVLEVTETARIRDLSAAARILGQLKHLGVKLSMDDFGVGMANYETFYELPFDELKIDRLFIKNIQRDPKARAIASSLVAMGKEARIAVTAEGVEDPEDLAILEEIGCHQVQGYAISRPITLSNLLDFLGKRQKNMV